MRILIMADTPFNPDSGASGTEYQTAEVLRRLGHEVDTVWGDQLPKRIQHGNLHYLLELPFAYRARLVDCLRVGPYDVIHVNQPHGYLAARHLRGAVDRPVFVHRSHGFEPRVNATLRGWEQRLEGPKPIIRRATNQAMQALLEINNRAIARYADGHIFSAELCADFLHENYGVPRSRIAVIPQAAPEQYLRQPYAHFDPARLDRILYVGQLAFFKGPTILARGFDRILSQRPQATLTWVCSAAHHQAAASLLSPAGRERVQFLDWMAQDQLMHIYDQHGVFLFPSLFEGFGKAFVEAMARGLVVVASAEGGARDVIDHGQNGFLAPPGDSEELAAQCLAVQSSPDLAQKIGANARAKALLYTWQRVADETVAFYHRLIDAR